MTSEQIRGQDTVLAPLARWARGRLDELVQVAYERILERIEPYRTAGLVPAATLRRSVRSNMEFLLDAIADSDATVDTTVPTRTGRERARQGMPLPEVLGSYRISFAVVWEALVSQASSRDARDADDATGATGALLANVGRIWQLTDRHAVALTEGYREATAQILLTHQQRRSALVEAMLTGEPGPGAAPWEAARLLGFPPNARVVVVAAETRGLAEESLPGIEATLAARGIVSGWRLTPALQLGIVAIGDAGDETALSILRERAVARVGVSPPYTALSDTPRALHLARVALAGIPADGGVEVSVFSASPLAALVASKPDESRRLAEDVLGPVLALAPEDRSVLLQTLDAYLDHQGSVAEVGTLLHCHPNTVRYRLRRVHQLTGRSLSDPRDLADLTTAAFALRLDPPVPPRA